MCCGGGSCAPPERGGSCAPPERGGRSTAAHSDRAPTGAAPRRYGAVPCPARHPCAGVTLVIRKTSVTPAQGAWRRGSRPCDRLSCALHEIAQRHGHRQPAAFRSRSGPLCPSLVQSASSRVPMTHKANQVTPECVTLLYRARTGIMDKVPAAVLPALGETGQCRQSHGERWRHNQTPSCC